MQKSRTKHPQSNAGFEFSSHFTEVLLKYLKDNYLVHKKFKDSPWNIHDAEYFARGIIGLNNNFTQNRAGKYRDYFADPVLRSGYLAYFLPVNMAKTAAILNQNHSFERELPARIEIADIGAGPLTMTFGFLEHVLTRYDDIKSLELVVNAFELNAKILNDGANLLERYLEQRDPKGKIRIKLNLKPGNILHKKYREIKCDYVLMGNFLNEFDRRDTQSEIVSQVLRNFGKKNGLVLFLEPGSKKFARDLQGLRDALIEETEYRVLAPCLHQHQCPLNLTAKSDWCNFTQRWTPPQFIRDFDRLTSMKKEYLLYSFLLMRNHMRVDRVETSRFIAISDLMKQKGRYEVIGCGEAGRIRFIQSNKDVSPTNEDLMDAHRGAQFQVPSMPKDSVFTLNHNISIRKNDEFYLV